MNRSTARRTVRLLTSGIVGMTHRAGDHSGEVPVDEVREIAGGLRDGPRVPGLRVVYEDALMHRHRHHEA